MRAKLLTAMSLIISVALLSACADTNDPNITVVGFFNSVVFKPVKVADKKYSLEATTSNGAPEDQLVAAYKQRAALLCANGVKSVNYNITQESYLSTGNRWAIGIPSTAPKLTGVVICN